jgi:hypothetical protein
MLTKCDWVICTCFQFMWSARQENLLWTPYVTYKLKAKDLALESATNKCVRHVIQESATSCFSTGRGGMAAGKATPRRHELLRSASIYAFMNQLFSAEHHGWSEACYWTACGFSETMY